MNLTHARRAATVIAGPLLCGLASIAVLGPLAGVASATTAPAISITTPLPADGNVTVNGSGFTPGGQVHVEADMGTTVVSSTTLYATQNSTSWVCARGVCKQIFIPGGKFQTSLPPPPLSCAYVEYGTIKATDLSTGLTASAPVSWMGAC